MKKVMIEKKDSSWIVKITGQENKAFRFEAQARLYLVRFFEQVSGIKGITLEAMNLTRYGYEITKNKRLSGITKKGN